MQNTEFESIVILINEKLQQKGYKSTEAKAEFWSKEVKPGQVLRRIYLNGKKANGYVQQVDGKWMREGMNFSMVIRIVDEVLDAVNAMPSLS